jgi:predicted O-methyltransferase YrrM
VDSERWTAVDDYLAPLFAPHDEALTAALAASRASGLPAIQVSPPQGKLLYLLARMIGARHVLEIGTLGGYSAIWMGRALATGGHLVTLESDPKHAAVACANLAHAGLEYVVELRLGPALDSLAVLAREDRAPFDLVFIDADKPSLPEYFDRALALTRPGGVIVADNVVREGAVIDAASADASVQGVRRLNARVAAEPRVSATTIQTVGGKGYDGFLLAWVVANGA